MTSKWHWRVEIGIAACLATAAAVIRFWHLTSLGLTHFDEGAYTETGHWLATTGHGGSPFQPVFSPPLFPSMVGAAFAVFGVHDFVAIGASAAAGSLTVAIVYLIARQWFDRTVGLVAALTLATCEYHVVFSRMALTDATFTLLFWTSVATLHRAIETGDRRWFVAGGLVTGLCWNTKYHGFLPLVFVGVWMLGHRAAVTRRSVAGFALACATALAMYLPWALYVHWTIGYGALVRTHVEHSIGRGLFVTSPAAIVFYLVHWVAAPVLLFAIAGAILAWFDRRSDARFVLFVTIGFLGLATLYLSFPRLTLPAVPGLCVLAGYGLDEIVRRAGRWRSPLVGAGLLLLAGWGVPCTIAVLNLRTDAYRAAADYVRSSDLPVISQLSKNYYFYESTPSTEIRFHGVAELDSLVASGDVLVVVDPIVDRLPDAKAWLDRVVGDRPPEREFPIRAFEPVTYQGFDPTTPLDQVPRSTAPLRPGESTIRVYRIPASRTLGAFR